MIEKFPQRWPEKYRAFTGWPRVACFVKEAGGFFDKLVAAAVDNDPLEFWNGLTLGAALSLASYEPYNTPAKLRRAVCLAATRAKQSRKPHPELDAIVAVVDLLRDANPTLVCDNDSYKWNVDPQISEIVAGLSPATLANGHVYHAIRRMKDLFSGCDADLFAFRHHLSAAVGCLSDWLDRDDVRVVKNQVEIPWDDQ